MQIVPKSAMKETSPEVKEIYQIHLGDSTLKKIKIISRNDILQDKSKTTEKQ